MREVKYTTRFKRGEKTLDAACGAVLLSVVVQDPGCGESSQNGRKWQDASNPISRNAEKTNPNKPIEVKSFLFFNILRFEGKQTH